MPRLVYRILGPLEVLRDGTSVRIGAARQRTLLAALLVHTNQVVDADRLIDYLWDVHPPASARGTLQTLVLRLRQLLEPEHDGRRGQWRVIESRRPGYRIVTSHETLDLLRFAKLAADGRQALVDGRADAAAEMLRTALGIWRGPALADVAERLRSQIVPALAEQRLSALEARVDADLALGRHAELVGELRTLVAEHPLHERLHGALMRALQRCGRRAEALDVYRTLRRVLVTELGVEPDSDLQNLHLKLLGRDPATSAGPGGDRQRPPAQLPADVRGFVGRVAHLARLTDALPQTQPAGPVSVPVIAITGTAGVGKTALAVHWAHGSLGAFRHGQLYIDLRGHSTQPALRPLDALAQLLRGLQVPPERVPTELAEAAALYRSLLACRQVIVVLDNAASGGQVRPLLPAGPGCVVIVTSRNRLSTLVASHGARLLPLDVLTPAESRQLLEQILGPERVAGEPAATVELARLCGHLPLALRTAAALLVDRPLRTIADHVADLRSHTSVDALGDDDALVRRAFELSYRALEPRTRRLFRLLGAVPGPDVTPPAVAALLDVRVGEAAALLDDLAGAHLVDEYAAQRFRCHDLVRAYAADLAADEEPADRSDVALVRLMQWYLATIDEAAYHLYPQIARLPAHARPAAWPTSRADAVAAQFPDQKHALAWLDAESANLIAAAVFCAGRGLRPYAWCLTDALRGYFDLRRDVIGFSTVARAGLEAAQAAGDQLAAAAAHRALGHVQICTAQSADALASLSAALSCSRQAGWRLGEAGTLASLGVVHLNVGNLNEATEYLCAALELRRDLGSPAGEANCHDNLAEAYAQMGLLELAVKHYRRALVRYRRIRSDSGEAHALTGLAGVCQRLGKTASAERHLAIAVTLYHRVGNLAGLALALGARADLYRDTGRLDEAVAVAREALDLIRGTGDRAAEAVILRTVAAAEQGAGRHQAADRSYRRALDLASVAQAPYAATQALLGLGTLADELGRRVEAEQYLSRAASIATEHGFELASPGAPPELEPATRRPAAGPSPVGPRPPPR